MSPLQVLVPECIFAGSFAGKAVRLPLKGKTAKGRLPAGPRARALETVLIDGTICGAGPWRWLQCPTTGALLQGPYYRGMVRVLASSTDGRFQRSLEQRACCVPDRSCWVSANAGTGKTLALTDRVLALLLAGARPERVLCLTYTRAAASEMLARIHGRLRAWAVAPISERAAEVGTLLGLEADRAQAELAGELCARILDLPGGLRVQTIHAFCQSVLARFPLEAGITPHCETLDEIGSAELLREACDRVLERAWKEGDSALARAGAKVAGATGVEGVHKVMLALDRDREHLAAWLREPQALARWERAFDVPEEEHSVGAERFLEHALSDSAPGFERAALEPLFHGKGAEDSALARCFDLATCRAWLAGDAAQRARGWETWRRCMLTKEGKPREKVIRLGNALTRESERVCQIAERYACLRTIEATQAMLVVAQAVLQEFGHLKRNRAVIDFHDQIQYTRALLAREHGVSWVLYKLDEGIEHLLIDEGQDTSRPQWELLERLISEFTSVDPDAGVTAPRTVFVVGDVKQSIFGFQGAAPQEFVRFGKRIGRNWAKIPLEQAYRSPATVLAVVDAVFADPDAQQAVTMGAMPVRHRASDPGRYGMVACWPLSLPSAAPRPVPWTPPVEPLEAYGGPRVVAETIATAIRRWLDDGERLADGTLLRPKDILILLRTRVGMMDPVLRALARRGIPVAGRDRLQVTDSLAVKDLIALGQFLLQPEDDLNLAALLKSPLVGLTEEELFALAWQRNHRSLWRSLRRKRGQAPAFAAAAEWLTRLLALAAFLTPSVFYGRVLHEERGWQRLRAASPDGAESVEAFLHWTLLFERDHPPTLRGFLDWLTTSAGEVRRDLAQGRRDEVRVMTIHSAKGLEAPVVFVAEGRVRAQTSGEIPFWPDEGAGIRVPLWCSNQALYGNRRTARVRAHTRKRAHAEGLRLLYVAMTRASERLVVVGAQEAGESPKASARDASTASWLDRVAEAIRTNPRHRRVSIPVLETRGDAPLGVRGSQGTEAGEGWMVEGGDRSVSPHEGEPLAQEPAPSVPDWAERPPCPASIPGDPLLPSRQAIREPADAVLRSPLVSRERRRFARGLLIHHLLNLLPALAPEERRQAADRVLRAKGTYLTPAQRRQIATDALALFRDASFGRIFDASSRGEVCLAGRLRGRIIAGRIDRLRVAPGEVLAVEYKTGTPIPTAPEQVPISYLRQLAMYRAVLASLYRDRTIVMILLWTDGPRWMTIPPDSLEACFQDALDESMPIP